MKRTNIIIYLDLEFSELVTIGATQTLTLPSAERIIVEKPVHSNISIIELHIKAVCTMSFTIPIASKCEVSTSLTGVITNYIYLAIRIGG